MDRFLVRAAPPPVAAPPAKRSKKAKQGDLTARDRAAQYVGNVLYADGGKLFCRPCNCVVDHVRKSVVDVHLKSKVG